MKSRLHHIVIILLLPVLFFSCKETDTTKPNAVAATLSNYTGLDGCGWVIKLENGEVLEPANLGSFAIELIEGKKVWITYTEMQDVASICMVGPIVTIDAIWDR
jgi:hypothetical protein